MITYTPGSFISSLDQYSTVMAAASLFKVPAVLENILLLLASDAVANNPCSRHPRSRLEPMTTIAKLQRINRTFYNVIAHSSSLKRAMLEPPVPQAPDNVRQISHLLGRWHIRPDSFTLHVRPDRRRIALRWLLEIQLGRHIRRTIYRDTLTGKLETRITLDVYSSRPGSARYMLKDFMNKHIDRCGEHTLHIASWRRVKV